MHDPLHTCPSSSSSASPPSISSARTCPGHSPLEFKIYRQPGVVSVVSPRVSDTGISPPPPPPPGRAPRFFATRCHGSGARSFLRLSRALTSPTVCLQRPVKRPTPSFPHEDLLNASRLPTHMDFNHRHVTTREVTHVRQEEHGQEDEEEEENREGKGEERRESFLDEDKTVQILHWLKEVDHKQSREGRCPVFLHSIYRES
ncbi:hypothetical protein V1264_014727 [Littorina saxatilis]|uniref:Uncharacterized protein n=1 Tax=Littorina saxatilis TaxID=31220 RepID=A0AAN9BRW0_9CAEN